MSMRLIAKSLLYGIVWFTCAFMMKWLVS